MDRENIETLAKVLGIPVTDLLEEKVNKTKKGSAITMTRNVQEYNYDTISEF